MLKQVKGLIFVNFFPGQFKLLKISHSPITFTWLYFMYFVFFKKQANKLIFGAQIGMQSRTFG
jgi:hypothetical protein